MAAISVENYLLFGSGLGVVTMAILLIGPLASWSPPYEELTLTTPALGGVVLVPLLLLGIAAIGSVWIARRPPLRRRRWQLRALVLLEFLAFASIIGIGVVFLVVFDDFNFDSTALHWAFYLSVASAAATVGAAMAANLAWKRREHPPDTATET